LTSIFFSSLTFLCTVLFGTCAPEESPEELQLELEFELEVESESLLILFSVSSSGIDGVGFGGFSKKDGQSDLNVEAERATIPKPDSRMQLFGY